MNTFRIQSKLKVSLILILSGLFACKRIPEEPITKLIPAPGLEFSGGKSNTVFDQSENAFGFQSPSIKGMGEMEFFVGNSFFNQNWVSAPSSTTARDGLGPTFNALSCSGCHFKDGRGRPPEFDGELSTGLLLRLSVAGMDEQGNPLGDPHYGGQLNDRAILGVDPEGTMQIRYTEQAGTYTDGETYSLRIPDYQIVNLNYGSLAAGIMISPRVAPQMIGLGLLESITEADLMSREDEFDSDGDGISGRANQIWDIRSNQMRMGRFGWKANQTTVGQQTAGAFLGDMGITTSDFPDQNCPDGQTDCQSAADGGSPEIEDDDLRKVILYASNLAVPARRNFEDQTVLAGQQLFFKIGCESCHTATYQTGQHPLFPNLSDQKIWPFTDLLLHDMGEGLADHRPDGLATGSEWRTPPLWGVGLVKTVNHHTNFLHDGRARNLEEAILWHGGEAATSNENFKKLKKDEREAIIKFLESL